MAQRFDDWEGEHLQHYGAKGIDVVPVFGGMAKGKQYKVKKKKH